MRRLWLSVVRMPVSKTADRMCWFFSLLVLYSAAEAVPPLGRSCQKPATAVRFQQEVLMSESTLTGPVLYMLIAWGIVTAVFLALLLWRNLLESHEDDQLFIDAAEEHMAKEQRALIQRINTLSRPIMMTGILAGVLLLASA